MRIVLRDKELASSSAIVLRSHAYHNDIDFVGSDLVTEILFDSQRKFFPNLQFFQQLRTQIFTKRWTTSAPRSERIPATLLQQATPLFARPSTVNMDFLFCTSSKTTSGATLYFSQKTRRLASKAKMILASASPHLRDAFKSKGFVDSGANEYYVEQLDHETLQIIVDFVYSSTLRIAGDGIGDRLSSVLIGADYLLMPDLVHICGQSLAYPAYLNVGSAVRMWLFARKYHCKVLEDAAVGTMATDLRAITEHDDYARLEKANVVTLLSTLMVAPPDLVCEAAVAWLGYMEERKADCDEVIRQVPLKAVSVDALQRASQAMFLSEQALWMIQQVQEVRAEVDKAKLEISVMTNDLSVVNDKFAKAKLLSSNRRQYLGKMIEQANTMDYSAIRCYKAETIDYRDSWIVEKKGTAASAKRS